MATEEEAQLLMAVAEMARAMMALWEVVVTIQYPARMAAVREHPEVAPAQTSIA